MFYSDTILSRRGPLGRVWLAAHMDRKLSKSQTLQTDIEQSVDAIMGQEIELMALRLSGQLLLGVVRIYSRKAKYLLEDCNEALMKIKLAFRPGVVDLTEDQLTVNKTAITLQTNGIGLDMLLPDMNWDMDFEERPAQRQGHHQAHIDDITLRTADDFQQFDVSDPFDIGPSDGIGSQDFNDVDLGIHWGDEGGNQDANDKSDIMSVGESVGVGRHAPHRSSMDIDLVGEKSLFGDDVFSHKSFSRDPSEVPFGAPMDLDTFPEVDLGDLGIGFDDIPMDDLEKTPGQTRESSRASSPLTELPPTPPPAGADPDVTIAEQEQVVGNKIKRKQKDKRQIIDAVTEIQGAAAGGRGQGRGLAAGNPLNTDVTSIITEQHFLPKSSVVMRLLEIRSNPTAHFLPVQNTPEGTYFFAGPPGLTSELAQLFARPVRNASANKRRAASPAASPNKRTRIDEVEQGRRQESLPPNNVSDSIFQDEAGPAPGEFEFPDQSGLVDDFQLDIPEAEIDLGVERARSVATDRSRLSTPGLEEGESSYVDLNCPIAIFDARHASQLEQSQGESTEPDKHGYSKNTVKALALVRKEFRQDDEEGSADKTLSFNKLAQKASRRAAASFFFELLVLGTRDCLQLEQKQSFDNIEMAAKPRLWEHQTFPADRDLTPIPV